MENIYLNNGMQIPEIGFGTAAIGKWQQDDEAVKDVILQAIEMGYRHIDTAAIYGNERSVGKAIEESGLARDQFFITSKLWDTEQGFKTTKQAFKRSLERLQTDYLDLYLIHWPNPEKTKATWQAMEDLYYQDLIGALGLSNFRASDIEQILSFARQRPTYNQLELHPYFQQKKLVNYCKEQDIVVACWSPLGTGSWSSVKAEDKPIHDPVIKAMATKYGVSPAQVILKWNLANGHITLPKSETPKNMQSNLQLDTFELSADDIKAINALDKGERLGSDPDTALELNQQLEIPA